MLTVWKNHFLPQSLNYLIPLRSKKKKLFQTKQNLKSFLRVLYVCESLLMTI